MKESTEANEKKGVADTAAAMGEEEDVGDPQTDAKSTVALEKSLTDTEAEIGFVEARLNTGRRVNATQPLLRSSRWNKKTPKSKYAACKIRTCETKAGPNGLPSSTILKKTTRKQIKEAMAEGDDLA